MEMGGVCPVCSELSRSLKKFEKQLSEERRWNLSQREYCVQLQQEMQKDKDLWQNQEIKLREQIKDLNDKIEEFYKTIQDQHKEKAHLEYKNEVLEDHKQELQDKVTMLQDKIKHICAEMSTAQYRSRMLEEKLTATTKLLEDSHKLKARISQAESQKSRLEMKANRLQEEKNLVQAELNQMRDENRQMQMQLIDLQQNLSHLDARTQQMEENHALQKKPDSLSDIGHLRDSNWGCRENNDITDDCAAADELQVLAKEKEHKDRNATFQNNCILKWQQQIAFQNGNAAAFHQVNEICTLTPTEVADTATECCDLALHSIEDCVKESGIKRSCPRSKDNQKPISLDEEKTEYDVSELGSCNACSSCRNEIQTNVCKKDLGNINKASHIITVSENVGILKESIIRNSIGYTSKCADENDIEIPISESAANEACVTPDKAVNLNAINLNEVCPCKNVFCMSSSKNNFINFSSIEPESFAASDSTLSHEQAEDIRNGTECTGYYEEKQTDVETLHPGTLFCGASVCHSEECWNETSGETVENNDNYAKSFTHSTKESTNVQHSMETISYGSENTEIVSNPIPNFGPSETKEGNYTNNSSLHIQNLSQKSKNIQTKQEGIISETLTSKSEATQTGSLDSVKSIEKEAFREGETSKSKDSSSILGTKIDNRTENHLVNQENKLLCKCNQIENETKLNKIGEKGFLDSAKSSQRVSSTGNEGSSNSKNSSQISSPRNDEGSSERNSQRTSPRTNGLNKNREKLSDLNKKYRRMENTQPCKENNHSNISSESLNNNSNQADHLMHKSNIHICSRNIQTENEILNDNTTLHYQTSNKGHLNSENTLGTICKGACRSNKIRGKLNASSKSNNSIGNKVTKRRNVTLCSKNIQTENGIQIISLSKTTITIDDNSVYKQNVAQCSKDGVKHADLNKNNKITDDTVIPKKTTALLNRDLQSDIGILSSVLNKNNDNNVSDVDLIHKRDISKYEKNIQTQNGVQSIVSSKTRNTIDDKLAYRMNTLQQPPSLSNKNNISNDNLEQKKGVSQSKKNTKNENGVQSSALNKNNTIRNDYHQHRKNTTQWNKDVQSKQGVHPIALNKSAIDNYFAYKKKNTVKCEKCEEIKNRTQPITAYKRNGFVADNDLAYKCNIPQSRVCVQNQNITKLHGSGNASHSSELQLKVLHEAEKTCMINCDTSSSDMCNDMFDSNIKATKALTQENSLSSSEEMSLVSAVKEGKFSSVEELLSLGTSPNCSYNGNTALHMAAETGNLCMCRLLLEAGARADARNSFSGTPLHAAAKCGNLEVGKLLVKWGASVELKDKAGNLASDIAVNNGHLHVYNWLQQVCLQEQ